jgi:asparagine N-glycosylation enzyme membrane subunit Stt3
MLLPIIPKNYNKIDQIFTFIIIIVSLGLFWLNYTNRISINQLLIGEITLSLALVALLLPPGSDIKSLSLPISFPLWVLPIAVYLVSEVEILLFRHTGLCYLLTLALALILTVLAEEKPAKK